MRNNSYSWQVRKRTSNARVMGKRTRPALIASTSSTLRIYQKPCGQLQSSTSLTQLSLILSAAVSERFKYSLDLMMLNNVFKLTILVSL